jgi:hypothetical protein
LKALLYSLLPQAGAETEGRSDKNAFFLALRFTARRPSAERKSCAFSYNGTTEVDALTRTNNYPQHFSAACFVGRANALAPG